MPTTPLLSLDLVAPYQNQKHVTINEAFYAIDGLIHLAIETAGLNTPPGTVAEGARYLIGAAPTGLWAGKPGQIALGRDGAWSFLLPRAGWRAWVADTNQLIFFNGTSWAELSAGIPGTRTVATPAGGGLGGGGTLSSDRALSIDVTNLAIAADAAGDDYVVIHDTSAGGPRRVARSVFLTGAGGGGGVTTINSGAGITGGPITSSGTLAADFATATPAPLGTGATGTSTKIARGDHVHDHGSQAGGTLHATATPSVAGFMAAGDKSKLDNVAIGATANATDAQLRDRATHTGTQPWSSLTGTPTTASGYGLTDVRTTGRTTFIALANAFRAGTGPDVTVNDELSTLNFDGAASESATMLLALPKSVQAGSFTAQFIIRSAGAGAAVFDVAAVALRNNVSAATAYGTAQQVTLSGLASGSLFVSSETAAVTPANGWAQSDALKIRIRRLPADAADTLTADAQLVAVRFFFTANLGNDA